MVADHLQALLGETNALDPFQSTTWVTLHNNLLREADMGKVSLLILFELSVTFGHGFLLRKLSE